MTSNILSIFDTEAQSEAGSWLHLHTPGKYGVPAYADPDTKALPLRIKVRGPESDIWEGFQRKAMQMGKDSRTLEEVKRDDSKLLARMTLEIENIPGFDNTREDLVRLYLSYQDIRQQVLSHIVEREHFLSKVAEE